MLNFYQADLLDQQPRFKISSIGALLKFALEVETDLGEWVLKVPMSIPAFLRTFFNLPEIVEDTTSLRGLTKLMKIWEDSSPDLQPSVEKIYSSSAPTTQRLGSCMHVWYETVDEALPFLQLLYSLWK